MLAYGTTFNIFIVTGANQDLSILPHVTNDLRKVRDGMYRGWGGLRPMDSLLIIKTFSQFIVVSIGTKGALLIYECLLCLLRVSLRFQLH